MQFGKPVVGPPWRPAPTHWKLDGVALPIVVPPTLNLVRAMLSGGLETPEASGLAVVIATTHPRSHGHLIGRLYERGGPVNFEVLGNAADEIAGPMLGTPRWTAEKIWSNTLGAWQLVEGELALAGITDVFSLPPHTATSTVMAVWRRRLERNEKAYKQFIDEIERPPRRALRREIQRANAEANLDALNTIQQLTKRSKGKRREADSTIRTMSGDTL